MAGVTGIATAVAAQEAPDDYDEIRVPEDYGTIQAGVEAAGEGDLVLVGPGEYRESVEVTTANLTVRGTDRNDVVLDGEFQRPYGVDVEADGVAVENVTARHYRATGFYWHGVEGFRGSFLTAYNDGGYGVYAYRSRDGRFEYSYASGHPDAGFYLGRNQPYEAVIANVVAEHNAMGYSGTSTGADLTVRDSVWMDNMVGIAPNTLDTQDPRERASRIVGNVVLHNDNADAPSKEHTYPPFGTGIVVWGGNDNLIEGNLVAGHENFGIAVAPNVEEPSGNVVRWNVVRDSGVADLALAAPTGGDNRFVGNGFSTSLPSDVERDPGDGSERAAEVYDRQRALVQRGDFPSGDWREQPTPGPQPPMPDPDAPPLPAAKTVTVGPETVVSERDGERPPGGD